MMRAITAIAFASFATFAIGAHAKPAPCVPSLPELNDVVIPQNGANDVPTNATPFVGNVDAVEIKLVDGTGAELPSTTETISLDDGHGVHASLKRIVEQSPFQPGAIVSVVADGSTLTQFTVGNDALTSTPAAPNATLAGPRLVCAGFASVDLAVQSEDAALFIAAVDDAPTIGGGDVTLDGIADAASGDVVVFGRRSATVRVAAVNVAGHVGPSTPVAVKFPSGITNSNEACANESGVMPTSIAALAIGLAFVRRRGSRSSARALRFPEQP